MRLHSIQTSLRKCVLKMEYLQFVHHLHERRVSLRLLKMALNTLMSVVFGRLSVMEYERFNSGE